jgi:CHAT domain-containing protein
VFADPVFGTDDTRFDSLDRAKCSHRLERTAGAYRRLLFSGKEAQTLLMHVSAGQARVALGFDASLDSLVALQSDKYQFLHFATHGVFDSRRPDLSGVVLSLFDECGRRRDGFIGLSRIYNLRLAAQTVVLSACNTALGRDIKGEGLVGLVRGFFYSGTRSVVASLWEVKDSSTADLMGEFYRNVAAGQSPAAALRAAQLAQWRSEKWSAPYYWGAFVSQGDWQ